MRCSSCGQESPETARFCGACGAPVPRVLQCPGCGAGNDIGQRFCHACGLRLGDTEAPGSPPGASVAVAHDGMEGERKQVTVLFADVKGSMGLAGRMDPEAWAELMERFFAILREGVNRFEGRVDKFTGDGVMALFGAPVAYEDHAQRACAAALHLRSELARYGRELETERGMNFAVRMGLNSGEVVAGTLGEDLRVEYTAVGNTVGLAQRMESLAEPGTAYLTAATAALVEGYFQLRQLGPMEAKGVQEPVVVYELLGQGPLRTALEVAAARGFSRFVGREAEMAALEAAFARARSGSGQVVGVVAEPGVGKSRLCHEFAERCRAGGVDVFAAHGLAQNKSVPFVPVLEIVRAQFGVTDQDDPPGARAKLVASVRRLDPSLEDTLLLLYDFLGVPDPEQPPPAIDGEARQRRILGALNRLRRARSEQGPFVMLIEDLHWLDPGSEVFLENLVGTVPGMPLLVVTTFRPEYHAPWAHRSYYHQIPLLALAEEASEALLDGLLGADPSLDGLVEVVRKRTGGNPFFMEEVVQALVEDGSLSGQRGSYQLFNTLGEVRIPATVQAVLGARIDRLPAREKELLQTAAVIGRNFSARLIGGVVNLREDDLGAALGALVEAEFIYKTADYPEEEYTFKHALTEEIAYRSQLGRRRARTHEAVASAIAALDEDKLDERSALIAQHWEAGGELLEAARWNARAAVWAGFNHPVEAARRWRRVRALTDRFEQSPESAELAITARLMMLNFMWRLGAASEDDMPYEEEAATIFAEAEAFADATGQLGSKAIVLTVYGAILGLSAAVEEGYELSVRATQLADEVGDPGLRATVRIPHAFALAMLGRAREAVAIADEMIDLIGEDRSVGRGMLLASPYAWCRMFRAFYSPLHGGLDRGLADLDRAIELLGQEGDAEVEAWTHSNWAVLADLAGADPAAAAAHARQGLAWVEEAGGQWSRTWIRQGVAISYAQREEWREVIGTVDEAVAIVRDRRIGLPNLPLLLATRARAQIGLGDIAGARATAEEAVALAVRCGTGAYEVLARHQLARALLADVEPGLAEMARTELEQALSIAYRLELVAYAPQIHLEFAELARRVGDESEADRQLRTAELLFQEVGAPVRAAAAATVAR